MTSRPPAVAPLDLAVVEIEAADPEGLARFYAVTLGLPTRPEAEGVRAVEIGGTILRLRPAAPGTVPWYHLAFAVPENRIVEARNWLLERGVDLVPVDGRAVVDFPAWNAHSLYFHDPAGSVVELIARHDLPTGEEAPFGPGSLLRVDEVGLPTTAVPEVVAELEARVGALPYGNGSPEFRPVGDVHGLAIVVAAGRGWYPTGRPAEVHPLAVTVRGDVEASFDLPGAPCTVTVAAS